MVYWLESIAHISKLEISPAKKGIFENGPAVKGLNNSLIFNSRMVPELCWTMFGMKLVRYCLYMWLPMYLNQSVSYLF